jgi:hypothetical protein
LGEKVKDEKILGRESEGRKIRKADRGNRLKPWPEKKSVRRGLGLRFLAQMLVPGGSTGAPTETSPPAKPVSAVMNAYKDVRYVLWRN